MIHHLALPLRLQKKMHEIHNKNNLLDALNKRDLFVI